MGSGPGPLDLRLRLTRETRRTGAPSVLVCTPGDTFSSSDLSMPMAPRLRVTRIPSVSSGTSMLAAMRRALSLVRSLAAARRPGSASK